MTSCTLAGDGRRRQFEELRRDIAPEWIVQALEATGAATLRSRRLPAEQVSWLITGMALFRNRSINDATARRIHIPRTQRFTVAALTQLMDNIGRGGRP